MVVQVTLDSGTTNDEKWRKQQLQKVYWMLANNKTSIFEAFKTDLNKDEQEAFVFDLVMTRNAALETLDNLDKWTADVRPWRSDMLNLLGNATVRKEPAGPVSSLAPRMSPSILSWSP
jgi:aldehyde dehydrogenase (NAD+)